MIRLFFVLLVVFSTFNMAVCEADEIVHTMNFPKGDAAWAITLNLISKPVPKGKTEPSRDGGIYRQIKKIDFVRKGNLRRDTILWSDGSVTEHWWPGDGGLALVQDDPKGVVTAAKTIHMEDQRYDASSFAWVGKSTYMGMQPLNGKKCRYYRVEVPIIDEEKEFVYAWIDNETSRPVAWSKGGHTALFTFDLPIPVEPLVIPENFNKEFKRINAFFAPPKLEP